MRVLVVDDSAFMRRVVSEAIAAEPDLEVAGLAVNGLDALLKVEQLQPDVVTLDVEMPEMDGLAALRHLMARYPRPVVMVSSLTQAGTITTIRALMIGAVDFVAKPSGPISLDFHRVREELVHKIRVAARARVVGRGAAPRAAGLAAEARLLALEGSPAPLAPGRPPADAPSPDPWRSPNRAPPARGALDERPERLVVIGSSTGGPRALSTLVPNLPVLPNVAYLIVQHMPAGFTRSLAERLDAAGPLAVREAAVGDHLAPGLALVAPGDYHLRIGPGGAVRLDQEPRVHGVRPSVDVALEAAAQSFGAHAVAAVLTGMGQDGADGAAAVHAAGGYVLAEDESTCVVWGMPRAVAERGVAQRIVPLDRMAGAIGEVLAGRLSERGRAPQPAGRHLAGLDAGLAQVLSPPDQAARSA